MVDMTASERFDTLRDSVEFSTNLAAYGGPVVAIDAQGVVIARSVARFRPAVFSLSPDLEHFVFTGTPFDHPEAPSGVLLGAFHDREVRSLFAVPVAQQDDASESQPFLDWSPDGKTILVSEHGTILLLDVATGTSKKVADGAAAAWSPSGTWIAYLTVKSEAALLNLSTGESKLIDPGKKSGFPIEWSPDAKYLLIRKEQALPMYEGRIWIYRVSDGAWAAMPYFATADLHWHWFQDEPASPR